MLKCEDLAIVEELLQQVIANSGKPNYSFGKGGTQSDLTWLDDQGVPSNKTGVPFGLNNGKLTEVWVGNELLVEYDVGVYYHYGDEVGLTLLKQLTVPATSRTKTFNAIDIGDVSVPKDCQIATRVISSVSTSPKNTKIYCVIRGTQ